MPIMSKCYKGQAKMKKVFPGGVCDRSKPSVGYSSIKGTYQRY